MITAMVGPQSPWRFYLTPHVEVPIAMPQGNTYHRSGQAVRLLVRGGRGWTRSLAGATRGFAHRRAPRAGAHLCVSTGIRQTRSKATRAEKGESPPQEACMSLLLLCFFLAICLPLPCYNSPNRRDNWDAW